jgi:hypothetical protein
VRGLADVSLAPYFKDSRMVQMRLLCSHKQRSSARPFRFLWADAVATGCLQASVSRTVTTSFCAQSQDPVTQRDPATALRSARDDGRATESVPAAHPTTLRSARDDE